MTLIGGTSPAGVPTSVEGAIARLTHSIYPFGRVRKCCITKLFLSLAPASLAWPCYAVLSVVPLESPILQLRCSCVESTIDSADPRKTKDIDELRGLGVEIIPATCSGRSVTDLATVFARFDTLISCTGFVGGSGVQRKIARAALDAGVKRYFPWQFGVDYDVIGRGSAQICSMSNSMSAIFYARIHPLNEMIVIFSTLELA